MKIAHIDIENFRSIRKLSLDLGDTTVFIGPNNAGKTAILDAIRLSLSEVYQQNKEIRFKPDDIHLKDNRSDPKRVAGSRITLTAIDEESEIQDIGDFAQLDASGQHQLIKIRSEYGWSNQQNTYLEKWEFLGIEGFPLPDTGSAVNRMNLEKLRQYLPLFYLGAMRNVKDELISQSSQFWAQLINEVKIPQNIESEIVHKLSRINQEVLEADPLLSRIISILSGTTEIGAIQGQDNGKVSLRTLPSAISELLNKIRVVLQYDSSSPWLPILSQGEGIQSLLLVFMFQAFVECLLNEANGIQLQPILLIEEPETHLHPHAARTLWSHFLQLSGQKIISTHSPYFIQHIPIRSLRLVRLSESGTVVNSLPKTFSAQVPASSHLSDLSNQIPSLSFEATANKLTVRGALDEITSRQILSGYTDSRIRDQAQEILINLKDLSSRYVDDRVLQSVETFAQRIRGEIFFATQWLIVEGQTDYIVVHALAHSMGYNLDRFGVSVIDAQNSGKPSFFVQLAHSLNIPWQAVFDGDEGGKKYLQQIKKIGLTDRQMDRLCHTHDAGDLESQLIADGFQEELRMILQDLRISNVKDLSESELLLHLKKRKTSYAIEFAKHLREKVKPTNDILIAFQTAITNLCERHES